MVKMEIRGYHQEDLSQLTIICNAVLGKYSTGVIITSEELLADFEAAESPADDVFIAEIDGEIVGCAQLLIEVNDTNFVAPVVAPTQSGRVAKEKLFAALVNRAKGKGWKYLQMAVTHIDHSGRNFCAEHRFRLVHHFWTMECLLDDMAPIIEKSPGIAFRTVDVEKDITIFKDVFNQVFKGNWDFRVHTVEDIARWLNSPGVEAEGIFLAFDGSELVGFIGVKRDLIADRIGRIDALGVIESHRRRGIATTLIKRGFDYFRYLGLKGADTLVDAEDSGAKRFYESVGFKERNMILYYRLGL